MSGFVDIPGATGSTYLLTDSDAGLMVEVAVTAQNASGSSLEAVSAAVGPVAAGGNLVPPSITGTPEVGQTLTCVPGQWPAGVTVTRQWQRSLAPGSGEFANIPGATGLTYVAQAADDGLSLRVGEIPS